MQAAPEKQLPILFISHSTHGPTGSNRTRKVLQHLQTLLAAKWHGFVDRKRINPGDPWRTSILHHLEIAQAAILLFDEAAVKSKWVEAEALIFRFRRSMDSSFPLLPVLVDARYTTAAFLAYVRAGLTPQNPLLFAAADDGSTVGAVNVPVTRVPGLPPK